MKIVIADDEIKMVALNDYELENVVGGSDVEQKYIDPAGGAGKYFIEHIVKAPCELVDKLANKLLQIFGY